MLAVVMSGLGAWTGFGSLLGNQGIQSNPLTALGVCGSLEGTSPIAWRGMGGVGIGMNSNKVINLQESCGLWSY